MGATGGGPKTINEYVSAQPLSVREVLQRVREIVRGAAPDAQEAISYGMPAFTLNGIVLYFAAFKNHIGLYPPISGDARLERELIPYAGEKGNLRFPLDQPIPYKLIERIAKLRAKQNRAKVSSKVSKPRT